MGTKKKKQVKCISCRFAQPDESASEKNWTAYACRHRDSEYYGALLNVNLRGQQQGRITWKGCPLGVAGKRGKKP